MARKKKLHHWGWFGSFSQESCVPKPRPSVVGHLANQATRNGSYFGGESSFPALASNSVSDPTMGWAKVPKPKQVKGPAPGQEGGDGPQPETEGGI